MQMDTYDPNKTSDATALGAGTGAVSGLVSGASIGSAAGLVGTAVGAALGAVVGAVTGGVTASDQAKSDQVNALKAQRLAEQQKKDASITAQQQALLARPVAAETSGGYTPSIMRAASGGGYDAWKTRV